MNPNRTEIFAAWIVALALIAVMGVHALLPAIPPRLAPGVTDASQPRPPIVAREAPDVDVPLFEFNDRIPPPSDRRSLAGPEDGPAAAPLWRGGEIGRSQAGA